MPEANSAPDHVHSCPLKREHFTLVGHDLGGMVAFAYARSHPAAVLPGFGLERLLDFTRPGQGLPHLVFFMQRQLPELLISGRERAFLARFVGGPAMVGREAFARGAATDASTGAQR